MTDVQIILPAVSDDAVSEMLYHLTEAIAKKNPGLVAHGCLGGEFGYGAHCDTPVFMMHPFCWCEREDCPWCGGCDCPSESFHYFVDGEETDYQGWMDFYMRHVYGSTDAELTARGVSFLDFRPADRDVRSAEANKRRSERHDPVCNYCLGRGLFASAGAEPQMGAPNFWHKASNMKVWWYKYIGRDMKAKNAPRDLSAIFTECLASLEERMTAIEEKA